MTDDEQPSKQLDTVVGNKFEYEIGESSSDGVFRRFESTYGKGVNRAYIYRTVQGDEDLFERHQEIVSNLQSWVPDKHAAFFPTFLESGTDQDGHWVAVEYLLNDKWYSLKEVSREYRTGISGRDAIWMFKRILVAIGNAHDVEVLHGAVNEDNVFIHPEKHGLVLDGWGYSADMNTKVSALPPGRTEDYPDSIGNGTAPLTLDLTLAAKMMLRLMKREPKPLRRFFNNLTNKNEYSHPSVIIAELDKVAEGLYGPPAFSEFKMPKN